ncbi:MAG: class I SAM-dependent methyltransferase [Halobacteriota archaeon]
MYEDLFPVEMKGSVASMPEDDTQSSRETLTRIWDEQYILRPSWWKGPYDLSPIIQRLAPGADVLDVGCGAGRYLIPLARTGFRAVGADFSERALALLDPWHSRVVADVQRLPFSNHSFDAVTCYGVLQHLTQAGRVKAVTELFRLLQRQGLAFVEVAGRLDMRYGHGKRVATHTFVRGGIPHHYFSPSELHELFQSAGFAVLTLDERITQKQYDGAVRIRHRILTVMAKP